VVVGRGAVGEREEVGRGGFSQSIKANTSIIPQTGHDRSLPYVWNIYLITIVLFGTHILSYRVSWYNMNERIGLHGNMETEKCEKSLYKEDAACILKIKMRYMCSKAPLIWINWDVDPSGYAENSDNWIFL